MEANLNPNFATYATTYWQLGYTKKKLYTEILNISASCPFVAVKIEVFPEEMWNIPVSDAVNCV